MLNKSVWSQLKSFSATGYLEIGNKKWNETVNKCKMTDNKAFEPDTGEVRQVGTTIQGENGEKLVFTPEEKKRIYKNLSVLSVAFMLLYSSYMVSFSPKKMIFDWIFQI